MLQGKVIVVGVCGGIAAYKIADVVSRLKKLQAEVHVIMTQSATEFITPLTLGTLSQNAVAVDMFWQTGDPHIHHIELAQRADLILIAPATANMVGKIANGIADDLLSTTVMAATVPLMLVPSMNVHMYENPIFQENLRKLRGHGYRIIEPASGHLACGDTGKGRLPEVEVIVQEVVDFLTRKQDLIGRRIIVTAGGTREALDPVRFISNRSTGKMGYAVAEAARNRGAEVILISAPTFLPPPAGVQVVSVTSAREMHAAVMEHFPDCDAVIKTAAVADYRPRVPAEQKIKKSDGPLVIELERNPDILYELGQRKNRQVLVGFAAETQDLTEYAREKIEKKNLDFIVANDVTREGAGFGTDTNIVSFIFPDGRVFPLPQMSKAEIADRILDEVVALPAWQRDI
ncbi:MAG: bifunctional phosphopantothenoylcysteine decarboxylase/phosphopantothenate--cysteine ligase CoaBC [Syntrophomonadaceae bacterium]|nr:bifunctional phosphopantothenoylcysteine decarboxylase/phosphopantothenate--cysteine ligase CoaBC [Syntrophomonadaceae bacterium]